MRKHLKIICVVLILIVFAICSLYIVNNKSIKDNPVIDKESEKIENDTSDKIIDQNETEDENKIVIPNETKEEQKEKEENIFDKPVSVENDKNNQNTHIQDNTINNDKETIIDTPHDTPATPEPVIVPEKPKNNPWDSLGITEYDYYNKPAHSWAELDFKVSDYGSREKTLEACQKYGNNYISENGGGYFCDSVNSYSGDYLGEDIDFY